MSPQAHESSARHTGIADAETVASETNATNPATVRVLSGNPTPAEVAVVSAVIEGLARQLDSAERVAANGQETAWQKSLRPVRRPILPGARAWRGFAR